MNDPFEAAARAYHGEWVRANEHPTAHPALRAAVAAGIAAELERQAYGLNRESGYVTVRELRRRAAELRGEA